MHVGLSLLTLFPGRVGGSETYVQGLLGGLADAAGPERLTLLGNRHVGTEYAGRPVRPVPSYRPGDSDLTRFLAMNAGRVRPVVDGREFDVAHYPLTVPVPRIAGAPRVVTVHDLQHAELPHLFSRPERWLRAWAYDDSARAADHVITVSEHARAGIVTRLGVDPHRVHAIHSGVDHDRFRPAGPRETRIPGPYVLYPANAWPHKNHARLLEAWREVASEDLWLVLTGRGANGAAPAGDRVLYLGHVPIDRVAALMRGAEALLFPSLFEGFGQPVVEAMACGTPVACSAIGALTEVAGSAALTFDPHDPAAITAAIEQIVSDAALRERLRAAGLRRAADFTWEESARRHLEVYALACR